MNYSCLFTASPQPNYQLVAATTALREHRIDCCAGGRCFTFPARAIQQAARVAGSAVRPLLRTGATRPLVHPGDLKLPWLEILGIYAIETEAAPTVIIALGASSPAVIENLIKPGLPEQGRPLVGQSEKIRLLSQVADLVGEYESAYRLGTAADTAFPDRILLNLENTMDALQSSTKERHSKGAPNSSMLFVCRRSGFRDVEKLFVTAEIPVLQVETICGFMAETVPNWRSILGTGWLPRIDCFEKSLRKALGSKILPGVVQTDLADSTTRKPAELAVCAAAKFAIFGWLPQHGLNGTINGGKFEVGQFVETLRGTQTDGDVTLFSLARNVFPGEEELRLKTSEERLESSWMQFQTPHAEDEVFLFCSHSAYGDRHEGTKSSQLATASRQLMPLGFLNPASLGVLRCLFPLLKIDVVAYSPAASKTTRSAVVERMLRLAKLEPVDPQVIGQLQKQIHDFRKPDQLAITPNPPHLRCIELDDRYDAAISSPRSCGGPHANAFPASWPRELLGRLLEVGRNGQGLAAEIFSLGIRLTSLLLRVDPDKLQALILGGDAGPTNEFRLISALYEIVRTAAAGDPDVRRTRGARFGHLALRKDLVLMLRDAAKGRLAVPPLLAEWITKNVKITCVMPMDALLHPQPTNLIQDQWRPLPCGFQSYTVYPKLFSPVPTGASIAADIDILLEHAIRALDAGDGTRAPGWLANKISQTNELTAAMMIRTGHVEDFPYGDLLSQKTSKNTRVMLAYLPSQILVRCILLNEHGRELLKQWCYNLFENVSNHGRIKTEGSGKYEGSLSSESQSLLAVFMDTEGMAAAALDCCRDGLLDKSGRQHDPGPLRVHFLPDELAKCFQAPLVSESRGA